MPPFVRILVIGLVLAVVIGLIVWKYYDYLEKRSEQRHRLDVMREEHEQEIEDAMWSDDEDSIDRELRR